MKRILITILVGLLLGGCNTSQDQVNQAVKQTLTAQALRATDIAQAVAQTVAAKPCNPSDASQGNNSNNQPPADNNQGAPKTDANNAPPSGNPGISFTHVPPLGSYDEVSGKVIGVDPEKYEVAIYIKVSGGWWTKPTFAQPTLPISSDGTWSGAFISGGNDASAKTIRAYLIPVGFNPPARQGESSLPDSLKSYPVVEANRQ